jgi:hypothetical protein
MLIRKLFVLIFFTALLSACSLTPNAIPESPTVTPTATLAGFSSTVVETTFTPAPPPETVPNDTSECENAFYPVSDEATWVYDLSSGGSATHTMAVDEKDAFTITVQGDNSLFTIDGKCSDEGILIMDDPGAATTYSGQEGSSVVSTVDAVGVTLPKDIGIGQEWSQIITVTTGENKAIIETNYNAVGFENITVPAGNFYVLKVEQSGTVKMQGHTISMHGFQWFAEGVGTVKSAMDGAPTVELVSYDIPD